MNIQKVGKKYRLRQMVNGKTYSLMLDYKPTKRDAYLIMAEKTAAKKNYDDVSLCEACEAYLRINSNTFSPSTLKNDKVLLNTLKRYKIMDLRISEVDDLHLQSFINDYSSDHSPRSVRIAYFFICVSIKKFNKKFSPDVTLPKQIKYMPYIPTDEDIKKLLEFVRGTKYETAVMLGLMGLRMSEVLGLDIKDIRDGEIVVSKALVRGEEGFVIKSTKNFSSTRTIPVSKTLTNLIKKQGYVTRCTQAGLVNFMRHNYKKYSKEYFSFHKLRHYWASKMAEKVSPPVLKTFGGWNTIDTPNRYYIHEIKNEKNSKANIEYFESLKD